MGTWAHAITVPPETFNFDYAFRPIYYFSRYVGLWPFSIICESNRKIRRARIGFFDVLRSILIIYLNLTLTFCGYKEIRPRQENHTNNIRFIVFMAFQLSSFLFIILGIVLDVINRKKFVDILLKFNTFDHKVRHFCQISFANSNAMANSNIQFCFDKNRYQNSALNSTTSVNIAMLGCISWQQCSCCRSL